MKKLTCLTVLFISLLANVVYSSSNESPCPDFSFTNVPENDTMLANHWVPIGFTFEASTNDPQYEVTEYAIISDPSGLGIIYSTNGGFVFDTSGFGDYPVTIAAIADCPDTIEYSFIVHVPYCDSPYQLAIESDSIPNNVFNIEIPVLYASHRTVYLASNGFTLTATGDINCTVDSLTSIHIGCSFNYLVYNYDNDVDSVLIGLASAPQPPPSPCLPNFPNLSEFAVMHVSIEALSENAEGTITIDSTLKVDNAGIWIWDLGSYYGTVYPSFNCSTGPAVITYYQPSVFCGDANSDGTINVTDAVYIINYIFIGGEAPYPLENPEVNCDGAVNVSDAVWIINYIFVGGNAPCDVDGDGEPDC
jgi:Dockerin type I domain